MLDVLRIWAAFEIALFHAKFSGFYHTNGYVFADFFFILSGFILAEKYFLKADIDPFRFIRYRFLRLYPLHLLGSVAILLHYLIIKKEIPDVEDGALFSFLSYIFLTVGLGFRKVSDGDWNFPTWAVSAEFWANAIFILYFVRSKMRFILVVPLIGYLLIFSYDRSLNTFFHNYFGFLSSGLVRALAGLCLGTFLNYGLKQFSSNLTKSRWFWSIAEVILLSSLGLLLNTPDEVSYKYADFIILFIFSLSILTFSLQSGVISLLLIKSRLNYLGPLAYAIYIFHWPLVMFIHDVLKVPTDMKIYVLVSLLLVTSGLIYAFIERPLSERFKKFR